MKTEQISPLFWKSASFFFPSTEYRNSQRAPKQISLLNARSTFIFFLRWKTYQNTRQKIETNLVLASQLLLTEAFHMILHAQRD